MSTLSSEQIPDRKRWNPEAEEKPTRPSGITKEVKNQQRLAV
jgi:hypothetical protein